MSKFKIEVFTSTVHEIESQNRPRNITIKSFNGHEVVNQINDPSWTTEEQKDAAGIFLNVKTIELPVLHYQEFKREDNSQKQTLTDHYICFNTKNDDFTKSSVLNYINSVERERDEAIKNMLEYNSLKRKIENQNLCTRRALAYMSSFYDTQLKFFEWSFITRIIFRSRIKRIKKVKSQFEFLQGLIEGRYVDKDIDHMFNKLMKKFHRINIKNSERESEKN